MGGKNDSKTTTKVEPWKPAQGYLRSALHRGESLYRGGGFKTDPYEGERVAQFSPDTMAGIEALAGTANNPMTGASQSALLENLNMDNTYRDMDLIKEGVVDDVKSNLANTFAGGAINSGLAGGYASSEMARALAGVEYDQYNNAKGRQLSAMSMAPMISNMGRADAGALLQAGGLQDAQSQANIDADMSRYYEGENADLEALNRYSAFAQGFGGMGSSGTQTGPGRGSNPFSAGARGLGTYGALLGAGLTGPMAIGGGVLAGLGSLF